MRKEISHLNGGERQVRERSQCTEKLRKRELEGAVHETICMFLFQLARHDFSTASSLADMTSLAQTEPMSPSLIEKWPNALMRVARPL